MAVIVDKRPPSLPVIDALRGLAILGVIMVHANDGLERKLSWVVLSLSSQGGWGVQLFFIVSAFTLLMSWHGRQEGLATTPFLIRRFFRVAPMFYAAILLYAFLDGFKPRAYAPQGVGPVSYISTFLFLHGWHPATINSIVPGGWSIAAEFGFYLLFPLLAISVTSLTRALWAFGASLAIGAALTAIVWYSSGLSYAAPGAYLMKSFLLWWLPSQLPVFMLGFILYFLVSRAPIGEPPTARMAWRGRALTVGSAGAAIVLALAPLPLSGAAYLPFAVLFTLACWGLLLAPWKALEHPALVHIGKVSYSAYFLHFLVFRYAFPMFPPGIFPSGDLGYLLVTATAVVLTVALATMTHRWIEQPGIALGRRLAERVRGAGRAGNGL